MWMVFAAPCRCRPDFVSWPQIVFSCAAPHRVLVASARQSCQQPALGRSNQDRHDHGVGPQTAVSVAHMADGVCSLYACLLLCMERRQSLVRDLYYPRISTLSPRFGRHHQPSIGVPRCYNVSGGPGPGAGCGHVSQQILHVGYVYVLVICVCSPSPRTTGSRPEPASAR